MNRHELGIIGPTVCWYKVITARATSARALGVCRLRGSLYGTSKSALSCAGAADLLGFTRFAFLQMRLPLLGGSTCREC
ncbi:MAG: hypothetical protein OXF41_18065 [bacterium]|nr:hypothetical protein [bacterium]